MLHVLRRAVICSVVVAALLLPLPLHAQSSDSLAAARTAFAESRYEAVITQMEAHVVTDSSAEALYLLGRSHQALLQHEEALNALRAAHLRDTSSVRILQALGRSHEALSRFEDAEAAYTRALERSSSRTLHLQLADLYRRMRAWKEATNHYRVLLQGDSTNSLLHARLAQSLAAQDDSVLALQHYRRAHHLNPRSPSVALQMSRLLDAQDGPALALQVIDRTLEYQDVAALWKRRADLAFKQDSLAAASRAYERAIQRGDSSAANFRRLGIAHVGQQHYASALDALRRAHARDSTNVHTHFYLGVAYRGVDSLQQSATAFERAIELITDDVLIDAYLQAAVTHDERGELKPALDAYKTALKLQPARIEIYFHLATLYDRYYRNKTTAALYYRKFLTAADAAHTPLHTYASHRLEQLRPTLHFQRGRTN